MKKINWLDLIKVNIFWLGLNIRNYATGNIFPPYLVDSFVSPDVRNTAIGISRAAGLIVAMLVQPVMGLLSDRSTSRFGRRRPFIFVGVLLDLVFLALFIFVQDYWFLFFLILFVQFSANISHAPLLGLIPDLIPQKQQGTAAAVKSIFELLPLVLAGMVIAPMVGAGKFNLAVLVTGILLVIVMLVTVLLVKEKPLAVKPDVPLGPTLLRVLGLLAGMVIGALTGLLGGSILGGLLALIALQFTSGSVALAVWISFGGAIAIMLAVVAGGWSGARLTLGSEVRELPSFVWWVTNRLMFLTAITSLQSFAPFFLMYSFHFARETAITVTGQLITVVGVLILITSLPSGWLSSRVGTRRLSGLGGLIAAAGCIPLLCTIWFPSMVLIYVSGCILGIGVGLYVTNNWALGCSLVPSEQAGRYLGISNLAGAGAGMIGLGLGGPITDLLNLSNPGLGYFVLFASFGLLFMLSTVTLKWVHQGKPPC